ncbi:MAG: HPr family phosphocarrier protein [Oscillospiraceae bacterium]
MVSEQVTVINKMGFHMRPASEFVKAMSQYKSHIDLIFNGRVIDGKSIMNVMASCIKCGSHIEFQCTGPDEVDMLKTAVELVKNNLGDPE